MEALKGLAVLLVLAVSTALGMVVTVLVLRALWRREDD
jgi:hypothetical protein